MKSSLKKFMWLWEMIGAALILALSIIIIVNHSVLSMIVGLIFVFLGIFRLVPLIKTTDDKVLKWFYFGEIVLSVAVGCCLMSVSFLKEDNSFRQLVSKNCGYFIGAVLYLRGFTHFFGTSVRHEQYSFIYFIVHIILLTLGTIVIANGNLSLEVLAWIIFSIGLICTLFVSYNSYKDYKNYRVKYASVRITKQIEAKVENQIEAPTSDEINTNNVNIDNIIDDEQKDEVRI